MLFLPCSSRLFPPCFLHNVHPDFLVFPNPPVWPRGPYKSLFLQPPSLPTSNILFPTGQALLHLSSAIGLLALTRFWPYSTLARPSFCLGLNVSCVSNRFHARWAPIIISSNAFLTQQWLDLARDDVSRLRLTPPLVSPFFLVSLVCRVAYLSQWRWRQYGPLKLWKNYISL
jgi:hypothetical protein